MKAKLIAALVLIVLVAVVLLQNTQTVIFRFLLWKLEVSQLLLVLITLVIGFLIGLLLPVGLKARRRAGAPPAGRA